MSARWNPDRQLLVTNRRPGIDWVLLATWIAVIVVPWSILIGTVWFLVEWWPW